MADLKYIDLDKERDGVWIESPIGYAVKVRSYFSPRVQERLIVEHNEALKRLKKTELSTAEYADVMRRVIAMDVIVDWRDINQAPTFSSEKALEFMFDLRLRHFHDEVTNGSRDMRLFEAANVDAIEKN